MNVEELVHFTQVACDNEIARFERDFERSKQRALLRCEKSIELLQAGIEPSAVYSNEPQWFYDLGCCSDEELAELMRKLRVATGCKWQPVEDAHMRLAESDDFTVDQRHLWKPYTEKPFVKIYRHLQSEDYWFVTIKYVRRNENQKCRIHIERRTVVDKTLVCDT